MKLYFAKLNRDYAYRNSHDPVVYLQDAIQHELWEESFMICTVFDSKLASNGSKTQKASKLLSFEHVYENMLSKYLDYAKKNDDDRKNEIMRILESTVTKRREYIPFLKSLLKVDKELKLPVWLQDAIVLNTNDQRNIDDAIRLYIQHDLVHEAALLCIKVINGQGYVPFNLVDAVVEKVDAKTKKALREAVSLRLGNEVDR
jgi:hypothetical protein